MKRYRPALKGKEVVMVEDESGEYTSLTEYYILHDHAHRQACTIERLRSQRIPLPATGLNGALTFAIDAITNQETQTK